MRNDEEQKVKARERSRKYYLKNTDKYAQRNKERRELGRQIVVDAKLGAPCPGCNITYPHFVMDFHHRDPSTKIACIGTLANSGSVASLLEEIEKCDLLCSNCHRIREHNHLLD